METSWIPLGRNLLLIAQLIDGQQSLRWIESIEDDERSDHPKDVTAEKMSRSCTPRLCVKVVETCEACLAKWA